MKKNILLLSVIPLLLIQCVTNDKEGVYVPKQDNNYVRVYKPEGDYFYGPDTKMLKQGEWYDEWVPNDHTFIKGNDSLWHIIGITHPYVDPQEDIHQGEFASFHAISTANNFKETLEENHYEDKAKILPPHDRPGEGVNNHAPYIVQKDEVFYMFYGPSPIRLATSTDLYTWTPKGALFTQDGGARDPSILFHNNSYYISYCTQMSVLLRKSDDLISWSEPTTVFTATDFDPESPSIIKYNNSFYLFTSGWDGIWDKKEVVGAYQHNTYVFHTYDLYDFGEGDEKLLTRLNSHAPEVFQGEDGQWYISSVEWPHRGVSIDKLEWEEQEK